MSLHKRMSLHKALIESDLNAVKEIIQRGVDVTKRIPNGWALAYPLWIACQHDSPDIVALLIENGADPLKYDEGTSCLYQAAKYNCVAVSRLLVSRYKVDVNARCERGVSFGWAPLQIACVHDDSQDSHDNLEIVKILLEHGADPNIYSLYIPDNKHTPLHISCKHGGLGMVKLLLQYGADIQTKDVFGKTALDYARISNECYAVDIVTLLEQTQER